MLSLLKKISSALSIVFGAFILLFVIWGFIVSRDMPGTTGSQYMDNLDSKALNELIQNAKELRDSIFPDWQEKTTEEIFNDTAYNSKTIWRDSITTVPKAVMDSKLGYVSISPFSVTYVWSGGFDHVGLQFRFDSLLVKEITLRFGDRITQDIYAKSKKQTMSRNGKTNNKLRNKNINVDSLIF